MNAYDKAKYEQMRAVVRVHERARNIGLIIQKTMYGFSFYSMETQNEVWVANGSSSQGVTAWEHVQMELKYLENR
jgi:hypothetical protein